jgi:hypothetical protein
MIPRPVQHGVGVELVPVLYSIRTAVSASRESRLRRSPLHGETRRRTVRSLAGGYPVLLTRQFCDCLRDRVDKFICFIGIDFV